VILTANGQTKPVKWKKLQPKKTVDRRPEIYGINYWLAAADFKLLTSVLKYSNVVGEKNSKN